MLCHVTCATDANIAGAAADARAAARGVSACFAIKHALLLFSHAPPCDTPDARCGVFGSVLLRSLAIELKLVIHCCIFALLLYCVVRALHVSSCLAGLILGFSR